MMKTYEIANEFFRFRSGNPSAQHVSLKFADEDTEYIWQPRPGHWERGSFICFPLLGRLPEGKYRLGGREYELPMHGFAQSCDFRVIRHTRDEIIYELCDNEATRAVYPFAFSLRAGYALRDAALIISYEVENTGGEALPFSLGGHPGFSCPILPDEKFEDYELVFDREEKLGSVVTAGCPMDELKGAFGADGRRLSLDYGLFRGGSICFRPIASGNVTLVSRRSGRGLRLSMENANCFQIWTAPGSPFLAMEAWHGAITRRGCPGQDEWLSREGTIMLKPGQLWSRAHTLTPLR